MKRLGDGRLSMFPSSLDAVLAAVAIQRELMAAEFRSGSASTWAR